jgi:hypothetical protein
MIAANTGRDPITTNLGACWCTTMAPAPITMRTPARSSGVSPTKKSNQNSPKARIQRTGRDSGSGVLLGIGDKGCSQRDADQHGSEGGIDAPKHQDRQI